MDKEIIIYCQQRYNPYTALARDLMTRYHIPYREINLQTDQTFRQHRQAWLSQAEKLSLPVLVIALSGQDTPLEPPEPLATDQPKRGLDLGSIISAPNNQQLENWLHKHGFLKKPYKR